jgi:transposase-like protein
MVGHGQKFGRRKEEAIAALLAQRSIEDAARVVGITARTLYRWLEIPEFREAYFKARRQAFGQATARLQQASSAAASIILTLMLDPNVPATSRLRAAQGVLEHGARAIELEDLEGRLGRLEEIENGRK